MTRVSVPSMPLNLRLLVPRLGSPRLVQVIAMALVLVLGRVALGRRSLWFDEVVSANTVSAGLDDFLARLAFEPFNALYYIVLRFWSVLGTDEVALRSLSLAAAVATVPVAYRIAAAIVSPGAAALTVLLLASNALFVHYAQEARGYALAVLLVTTSSLVLVHAADRPTTARRVLYAGLAILSLYAHFVSGFVLVAHVVWLATTRRLDRRWLLTFGVVGAVASPLVPAIAFGPERNFLTAPTATSVRNLAQHLAGGPGDSLLDGLTLVACLAALALASYALVRRRRSRPAGGEGLLWLWLLGPFVGALAVSYWTPIWTTRYLVVVLPPLAMLTAWGLWNLRPIILRGALSAGMLALAFAGVVRWYDLPKEDWRTAVSFIVQHDEANDVMIFAPTHQRVPFTYYLGRSPTMRTLPRTADESDRLVSFLHDRGRRIWVVVSTPLSPDLVRLSLLDQDLAESYRALEAQSFGLVRLQLYEPLPDPPAVAAP